MGHRFATVLSLLIPVLLGTGCGGDGSEGTSVPPVPPTTSIAADDGSDITEWLLSAADGVQGFFLPTLAEIVVKAAPEIQFQILFSQVGTRKALTRILEEAGFRDFGRIQWREVGNEISWWTRDLFVKGTSGGSDRVLLLHHPDHYAAMRTTPGGSGHGTLTALRSLSGFRTVETCVRLEGGAVVAGERHVFTTPKYCDIAVRTGDHQDWPSFLTHLRELYRQPVAVLDVPLGETHAHPDTYLTPVGPGTVLLGDADLASSIVRHASAASIRRFLIRLGRLGRTHPAFRSIAGATPEQLADALPRSEAGVTMRLRRQLNLLGYRVVPVPWLALRLPGVREEIRFSYNNVILERRGGQRIVYLPAYGLPELDEAARKTWESQGFRVVAIDALGPAMFGGSVRCLSQVFRQAESGTPEQR